MYVCKYVKKTVTYNIYSPKSVLYALLPDTAAVILSTKCYITTVSIPIRHRVFILGIVVVYMHGIKTTQPMK